MSMGDFVVINKNKKYFHNHILNCYILILSPFYFKIYKKSNFDQNQLKFSTQNKNMYMYQKKL